MRLKGHISGTIRIEGNGHEIPLYNAAAKRRIGCHFQNTSGLDFEEALRFGRTMRLQRNLSTMTFYDRGEMLKKKSHCHLLEKEEKNTTNFLTNTLPLRIDSWVDIEGGFGTLLDHLFRFGKRYFPIHHFG